jgi:diguanylate cyclase
MRYSENRERSAEVLRLTLELMGRQSAALHPMSYTLWYEHVAGINPALSKVLESRLQANQPLSEDDVYELHARYIVKRDLEVLERLQDKLRDLLEEAAQATAAAVEDTGQYGVRLEETRSRLAGAVDLESVHAVIAELVQRTARIHSATQTVTETLGSRTEEVRALTRQLEQAQTEAMLDPLTGLKNRRGLERSVEDLSSADETLLGVALLLADIDHFKEINDAHGHLLGDKVLRVTARLLQSNIKGRDLAARLGGDEFAVLLKRTTIEGACILAQQIRSAIAAGRFRGIDGRELPGTVSLSVGVAIGRAGDTLESLLARADAALYEAKRKGRNRVATEACAA